MGRKLIAIVLRASWREVFGTAGIGLVSGLASAGLIAVVSAQLTDQQPISLAMIGVFLTLAVATLGGRILSQMLMIRFAQRNVFEWRVTLVRRILSSPYLDLEKTGTGKLLAVLTEDVTAVTDAIGAIPFLFINLATVAGCLAYLLWLSLPAFCLVTVFLLLGMLSYRSVERRATRSLTAARRMQDDLVEQITHLTRGLKELLLQRERRSMFLSEMLEPAARGVRDHSLAALAAYSVAGAWAQFLLISLLGILLFALPVVSSIPAGTTIAYSLTLLYMLRPMDFVLQLIPYMGKAEVAMGRIDQLGLHLAAARSQESPPSRRPWKELTLRGVRHRYRVENDDDSFELGPIDLVFKPAEVVFVVGGNGSGKSTLAKVLTGLYAPTAGALCLDGEEIHNANIEWYRQYVTAVFSDAYVIPRIQAPTERGIQNLVQRHLEELHLDGKVRLESGELQTAGLSQGQWKRLALLLAYLENRPIFILDEWAADQDPGFREVFYHEILPELKQQGKLVIVISHDERFYDVADRVIKLEVGRLV